MTRKVELRRVTLLAVSLLLAAAGLFFQPGFAQAGVSQADLQTILVEVQPEEPGAEYETIQQGGAERAIMNGLRAGLQSEGVEADQDFDGFQGGTERAIVNGLRA